ncbi:MAG: hypothetical protein U9O59_08105 [Actinomycetota bacterium]|nr:hypothetical protein [Actinomycetota bacterium]
MIIIAVQPIDITQIIVAVIAAGGGIFSATIVQLIRRRQQQKVIIKTAASRKIKILIIVISISSLLLIGNLLFFLFRPKTKVEITCPHNEDIVEIREMVRGTSQNIPDGQVIYIVIYPHIVGLYYPQDNLVTMQENGEWSSLASIGVEEDIDKELKFDIVVGLANKEAQDVFNIYFEQEEWSGLKELPKGALIYDHVTVIRE